jgi:hypothetical protein
MRKTRKLLAAAMSAAAAVTLSAAAPASASSARHLQVRVTWRHGHAVEIVTVVRDPRHLRVAAIGNCASTGIGNVTGRVVSRPGGVSRVRCPWGWWVSAGYETSLRGRYWTYHPVIGTRNLIG